MPTTDPGVILRQRFGRQLRLARLEQELSQAEVGLRAGLPQSTVSEAERGLLGLDSYAKIARALGVSLIIDPDLDDEGAA